MRVARNVLVVVLSALWLIPTYLLVVNSFSSASSYSGRVVWWPSGFALFHNMSDAFSTADFGPALLSSLAYAVVCGAVAVFVAALAGFALSAMPGRGKVFWFWAIYAGALFPLQAFLRPLFSAYAGTGLYDNRLGLFLVYTATCLPFSFFITRNHMITVPRDISEAAQLDGANWWRVFAQFYLPLSRSALAAAFIFQFVWVWNELLFGITLSFSEKVRPIMAALAGLQGSYGTVGPPVVLAGALLVSLPTLAVFLAFQRMFVAGFKINL
jgi:multiple sugar transport system permease protein